MKPTKRTEGSLCKKAHNLDVTAQITQRQARKGLTLMMQSAEAMMSLHSNPLTSGQCRRSGFINVFLISAPQSEHS
jgi:hypothetical protein